MSKPLVYISDYGFLQMLVAAVELYPGNAPRSRSRKGKKGDGETFGYIFGSKVSQGASPVYRIEFVVPCQRVVRRDPELVEPCSLAEKRILSVLAPFPGLDLLGTFHSHIYTHDDGFDIPACVAPSEEDHASWREWWNDERKGTDGIELIVGLKELKRRGSRAPKTLDNCILGTWEKYTYAIGAWHTTKEKANSPETALLDPTRWLMCPIVFGITKEDLTQVSKR